MKERLKELRETLGYTQRELCNKTGMKQSTYAGYEAGTNTTPMRDSYIQLICSSLGVNEDWLKNGNGNMFLEFPVEDEFTKAAASISNENNIFAQQAIIQYYKLSPDNKRVLENYIKSISENLNNLE